MGEIDGGELITTKDDMRLQTLSDTITPSRVDDGLAVYEDDGHEANAPN